MALAATDSCGCLWSGGGGGGGRGRAEDRSLVGSSSGPHSASGSSGWGLSGANPGRDQASPRWTCSTPSSLLFLGLLSSGGCPLAVLLEVPHGNGKREMVPRSLEGKRWDAVWQEEDKEPVATEPCPWAPEGALMQWVGGSGLVSVEDLEGRQLAAPVPQQSIPMSHRSLTAEVPRPF